MDIFRVNPVKSIKILIEIKRIHFGCFYKLKYVMKMWYICSIAYGSLSVTTDWFPWLSPRVYLGKAKYSIFLAKTCSFLCLLSIS